LSLFLSFSLSLSIYISLCVFLCVYVCLFHSIIFVTSIPVFYDYLSSGIYLLEKLNCGRHLVALLLRKFRDP
jgi:hypothetical protein